MSGLIGAALRRIGRWFLAGALAILPVVITVAVVVWVADLLRGYLGPRTVFGRLIRNLGLRFGSDETAAYVTGAILVVAAIFIVGILVELGARSLFQRFFDAVLARIPMIGGIYGTSKQLVSMLDTNNDAAVKGMKSVFCVFGQDGGVGVLALLVSPEKFRLNGRDYFIVIIPTAPVPIGGGLLFMPVEMVRPTDVSVEGLMSIYVSMGVTAPEFLPPASPETVGLRPPPAAV